MQFSKCDFLTVINCFAIIYCFRFFNLEMGAGDRSNDLVKKLNLAHPVICFSQVEQTEGSLKMSQGGSCDCLHFTVVIKKKKKKWSFDEKFINIS